ncbi:MAG: tRNA threonylcarbamoyladenosine dehydratase [Clostridia bacterium]|nr:tRNA threonylcarbamoyladenosine dehydratase [Clostridia bacterium]
MIKQFSRTEMLIGKNALATLKKSRVAVFGAGGVGGYVIEALARSGVGAIDIIDNDTVSESNINRQIIALRSTIGLLKTEVVKKRVEDINPECKVTVYETFVLPENIDTFDFSKYDYVVDAIDTVSGKLAIIEKAYNEGVPVISSMGTGNKLDPTKFSVTDISKTSVCPLARVMRYELKKRGIKKLKVLFSTEEPIKPNTEKDERGKVPPGSISFVPSVAGLIIGGGVIKDLIKK